MPDRDAHLRVLIGDLLLVVATLRADHDAQRTTVLREVLARVRGQADPVAVITSLLEESS